VSIEAKRFDMYIICKTFYRERKTRPVWFFAPPESYRLIEQDITDFVNCVKENAFISIFNKNHADEAAKACQYLSMLRPELIIPSIVERSDVIAFLFLNLLTLDSFCRHFSSIYNITEPHRFTSIMNCLTRIARQIVQQTPSYSQGQIYVLPLLISVLPGIDLNDLEKTSVTFEFLDTILMVITCVDCSSAVNTRNDLTEVKFNFNFEKKMDRYIFIFID
jgi:proteasome activator subunit 4